MPPATQLLPALPGTSIFPLKPVSCLGNPCAVQAIELTHQALFYNQGQNCCAGSRLYVHSSLHDEVAHRLTERAKKRVVGDPFLEDTEQGPQVSPCLSLVPVPLSLVCAVTGLARGLPLSFGLLAGKCPWHGVKAAAISAMLAPYG